MSSNHPSDPRHPSERTPQSIPLQDLPRTPTYPSPDTGHERSRRSTGRGRTLLGRGREEEGNGGNPSGARYARVSEESPTPYGRALAPSGPRITTPFDTNASSYRDEDVAPVSPLEDMAGFQEALGFAGLSFRGEDPASRPPDPTIHIDDGSTSSAFTPHPATVRRNSEESQYYFSPADSDTTPLTNPRNLQPISGVPNVASTPPPQDRLSFQDVRISTSGSPGARLGDDLLTVEAGYGRSRGRSDASSHRKRSISSGGSVSPLARAGSMMRDMSQRVVNLSNEPDVVEHSLRRKPSQARMTEPPIFPAMAEYAHDEPTDTTRPPEKHPFSRFRGARPQPQKWPDMPEPNPLKGKTLGIFDADNKLRLKLCDLLVHP